MRRRLVWLLGTAMAATLTVAACGGSGSPTSPSPSPSPSPTPSPAPGGGTTITISSSGVVSPKTLTVPVGSRVTFVNNDSRAHEMTSNPHPDHTDCPAINDVGLLTPGQTKLTGNLTVARTCGYHDHNRDSDTNLQGVIVIQ